MQHTLYHYRARVVDVYDGDTCRVDIDLGLNTWIKNEPIRLYRIDAPELRGDERERGLLARDYLRELVLDKNIYLQTIKDRKGKYGRYLGELWIEVEGEIRNVNDMMVEAGHAVYRDFD